MYTNLNDSNLSYSCLDFSNLTCAKLINTDLSYASLINIDLSGADLTGSILHGTVGIANKQQETKEAQKILNIYQTYSEAESDMSDWYDNHSINWIVGVSDPNYDSATVSRKMPTLAKYFTCYRNEKLFNAIERVASGEESIWN